MAEKEIKNDTQNDGNKTEESVTTSDEKIEKEEKIVSNPIREQQKRASFGGVICIAFIGILSFVVFEEQFLNLNVNTSSVQISSYWHKLEFVVCYQTIGISWILFNMFYVISKDI